MTIDLWMLLAAVGLAWVQIMLPTLHPVITNKAWAMGNRETTVQRPPWAERAQRASSNLQENLPLFSALVLIAHVSGQADGTTALGAQVFVGARVLHAAIYIAGVPVVRTFIWAVSVAGMAMIAYAIAT